MNSLSTNCESNCQCKKESEQEKYERLDQIIMDYKSNQANLIQILHYAQGIFGFISVETQNHIAKKLDMPASKVSGVVSFYSFFSSKAKGKHSIKVCLGTACYVRGGKKILKALKEHLEIDVGETTADGKFTIEVMRCIGACGLAPAIIIDERVYKQVNSEKLRGIINEY
jgi:NADH:ubiquinone oxidoreductase subunit E